MLATAVSGYFRANPENFIGEAFGGCQGTTPRGVGLESAGRLAVRRRAFKEARDAYQQALAALMTLQDRSNATTRSSKLGTHCLVSSR